MIQTKRYVTILFGLLGIVISLAVGYIYYFSKHYPIPLTNRISFDAKIKFVRDYIDPDKVDTLILGSSIGLNNIRGEYLEKASGKANYVLNFSVYEATTLQVEQLFELSDTFPNLKRVIYSAQYSDFPSRRVFENYDPELLIEYMRKELNPVEYWTLLLHTCNNLFFCYNRQKEWGVKHMHNNHFAYLGFDSTGSVPLHIYGKDIIQSRWRTPHPGVMGEFSFDAVSRMAKKTKAKGMHFYMVQQPYRAPLAKRENIKNALNYFAKRLEDIMTQTGGEFFSLHKMLHLDDKYFADRSHLNDKGSILSAEALAEFIDKNEK